MFFKILIKEHWQRSHVRTISGFYAQKLFKKTTLYVVRTDINGNYRNSAPCKNCYSVINNLGIKRIIFSTEHEDFTMVKTSEYYTEHISNGNRYLNMTDKEKDERFRKQKSSTLIKQEYCKYSTNTYLT